MPRRAAVLEQILDEETQGHGTRKALFSKIEGRIGLPLVAFFTSFHYPVNIDDEDVDALQSLLETLDLDHGFALMINSPGGYPLSAEKIIRVCRNYSGTGAFTAVVPGKAKSAATMICMGAEKIIMGPTSELGPVDPQVAIGEKDSGRLYSVTEIVRGFDSLFGKATRAKGRIEPYLQQLGHYHPFDIGKYRLAINLAEDITLKALASGMMKGRSDKEIRQNIALFLEPETKKEHGRAIHREEAEKSGLVIEGWNFKSERWKATYALYARLNKLVSTRTSKCIETKDTFWFAP